MEDLQASESFFTAQGALGLEHAGLNRCVGYGFAVS